MQTERGYPILDILLLFIKNVKLSITAISHTQNPDDVVTDHFSGTYGNRIYMHRHYQADNLC